MTNRNEALVRQAYQAYTQGDLSGVLELVDPDLGALVLAVQQCGQPGPNALCKWAQFVDRVVTPVAPASALACCLLCSITGRHLALPRPVSGAAHRAARSQLPSQRHFNRAAAPTCT